MENPCPGTQGQSLIPQITALWDIVPDDWPSGKNCFGGELVVFRKRLGLFNLSYAGDGDRTREVQLGKLTQD
jgi:hypothetical protein